MKIIHAADIHFGSKINSLRGLGEKRRREIRDTFKRMVNYAHENDVKVILLSGDVFDTNIPKSDDKAFFYSCIKDNPDIDFLYLRGNHDNDENYLKEELPNLKLFTDKWSSYKYDNIVISGIEITEDNYSSLYSLLSLNKDNINIVMLHGYENTTSTVDNINIPLLKNKNIDYLALGHIHSYIDKKLDDRGRYVYPGCLEGRGFDELDEKGFVLLDINDSVKHKFIPFSKRQIKEVELDLTGLTDLYKLDSFIENRFYESKDNIIRVNLVGQIDINIDDIENEVKNSLSDYYYIDVKNMTTKKNNYEELKKDLSLKGEFARLVLDNNDLSESDKERIISLGFNAIEGKDVK